MTQLTPSSFHRGTRAVRLAAGTLFVLALTGAVPAEERLPVIREAFTEGHEAGVPFAGRGESDALAMRLQEPGAGPVPAPPGAPGTPPTRAGSGVLNLPLEDLFRVPLDAPGTLTRVAPSYVPGVAPITIPEIAESTVPRQIPAAITRISDETIWNTGARSLNELIDICVPNAEVIRHNSQQEHLGFRGIINDKDNKYLLNVNGRWMNNRTQVGAFSENCLPMLGDIHHVDVIRGPASATYGPGAISGAVNIVTYNGLTFQGTDATVRQGFLEGFSSVELRHGVKYDEQSGLFVYYGYSDYPGAPQGNSPYIFGRSFIARDGIPVVAGQPVPFDVTNDHRSYLSSGRHKAHIEYTNGDLQLWTRYTRGGETTTPERFFVATKPVGMADLGNPQLDSFSDLQPEQAGFQQLTAYAGYKPQLTEELRLDLNVSWDMFDFERWDAANPSPTNPAGPIFAHREEFWLGRAIAHYSPLEQHELAFGYEYGHGNFGLDTANYAAFTPRQQANTQPWSADTHSLVGEYQWRISEQWTAFLSGRADKEVTYTPWLFSPRAALIYMPTKADTLKFIAAESVRRIEDDDLRFQFLTQGTQSESEKLRGLELRYERRPCEHWMWAVSSFYEDAGVVTFARLGTETTGRSQLVGQFEIWGLEWEAAYHNECTHLFLSHSWTKLLDAELVDPNFRQGVSAAPYGFGFDLANWSNQLTKIYLLRDLDPNWSASSSLRVYWGFPGAEDLTLFNNSLFPASSSGLGLSDPGYEKAYAANVYLDGGLERKFGKHAVVRLDLYNVLGWIDLDLNKRNYINRLSDYRPEAAAVALSARVTW